MNRKEVIAQLLKEGAVQVKGITIKNVTVTPLDEYIRLGLTIDKEVDGYRQTESGEYEKTKVDVIFVSAYSVGSILKDDPNAAFAVNHLLKHPDALGMILSRATIDIVQESVAGDEEYKNPFSSSDETTVFGHDTIINHVANINLNDFGRGRLLRLADLMLGFA